MICAFGDEIGDYFCIAEADGGKEGRLDVFSVDLVYLGSCVD